MATPNSLGLDFDQLNIQDPPANQLDVASAKGPEPEPRAEKRKPYVNAERVKTGGSQRDKLSEEALTERMVRMKEQNEKIKQRRLDVQADEEAFRKTQESERAKLAHTRKVQEDVDRTREQNAKRKMDKIQSREWDSGKPTGDWKHQPKKTENPAPQVIADDANKADAQVGSTASSPPRDSGNWVRGSPRGGPPRGRGRGRGRGGPVHSGTPQRDTKTPVNTEPPAAATIPVPATTNTPKEETPKDSSL